MNEAYIINELELDEAAKELIILGLTSPNLSYEQINNLFDILGEYNRNIAGENLKAAGKYQISSRVPFAGKAKTFIRQKNFARILKKAENKGKTVSLVRGKTFEKEFDKMMAQDLSGLKSIKEPTPDEINNNIETLVTAMKEYHDYKNSLAIKGEDISYDDIVKKSELWSKVYTANLEYLQNKEFKARRQHLKYITTALNDVPKRLLSEGGILCKIGDEPFTIRHDHKREDLEAFYNKYLDYNLSKAPQENFYQAQPLTNDKVKDELEAPLAENEIEAQETKEETQEITPNMQAYIDLMKLSGCSDEEAINLATDPANKEKFEMFDKTRGVTAYENAIEAGQISDDINLGQFQFLVALEDQIAHGMEVELPEKMSIDADEFNKGDIQKFEPELPEKVSIDADEFNKGDIVSQEDEFQEFEPEEPIYEVDNSAEPTRTMTPEEKAAYANLQSLPGNDLSGFDVSVYDENPAAFEPSPEDFNVDIQKTSRFQAVAEDLNYVKNQMPMIDTSGNMVNAPNSQPVVTTSRTR